MTKFVSVIGNGESRRGFDITVLKGITTVVGCNAIFRDHNLDYIVACDRHMCQEAANTCGKNTIIYTRENWYKQFAFWPNVKRVPDLPYAGDKRPDDPFHWGTGPHAGSLALTFKPKAIFLLGFDLYPIDKKTVNNTMEMNFSDKQNYPLLDELKEYNNNSAYRIEDDALSGWQRGGMSAREYARSQDNKH